METLNWGALVIQRMNGDQNVKRTGGANELRKRERLRKPWLDGTDKILRLEYVNSLMNEGNT